MYLRGGGNNGRGDDGISVDRGVFGEVYNDSGVVFCCMLGYWDGKFMNYDLEMVLALKALVEVAQWFKGLVIIYIVLRVFVWMAT